MKFLVGKDRAELLNCIWQARKTHAKIPEALTQILALRCGDCLANHPPKTGPTQNILCRLGGTLI